MFLRIPPEHFSSVYAEPAGGVSAQFVNAKTRDGVPISGWVTSSIARVGETSSYHHGKVALPFRLVMMMPGIDRAGRPILAEKLADSIGKLFVEITGRTAGTLVFDHSQLRAFKVEGINQEKVSEGWVMFGIDGYNNLKQTIVH